MKNLMVVGLGVLLGQWTLAGEVCYELSQDGQYWGRTPEMLCVNSSTSPNSLSTLTLKINEMGKEKIVAEFNLNLILRARCMDCNEDQFGISNPSNSIFNSLGVKFNGKRTFEGSEYSEAGTVSFGKNVMFYRK